MKTTTTKARRNALSRALRWLSRNLEVAYRLGASEERLKAEELKAGLINIFDNNN
jgi:hypothetical protein